MITIPLEKTKKLEFYYHNNNFESGDAEFLYNIIRHFKPKTIIEIGSGFSTLMALKAVEKNKESKIDCKIFCIEPFEKKWLNKLNVSLERELVENIDLAYFDVLEKNDILFIDSSHIIRPQGDVLFIYLHILPRLKPGVIIHIHDIFTPKDYLDEWFLKEVRFWNEQYLLEAFLLYNNKFKIIGALNYLKHHHPEQLAAKCPIFAKEFAVREPGSFWMVKV